MDRQSYLDYIKPRMNEKRYIHTLGVEQTAIELAERFGESVEKASLAAILHDLAKFEPEEEMLQIVREHHLGDNLANWGAEIMHGPVAAWRAEHELGITDEDVLNAMRYHTTGRANMSHLEQIVYIADMIEPNRKFEGVECLRKYAKEDLTKALKACLMHSISFLLKTEQPIHEQSIQSYNFYFGED